MQTKSTVAKLLLTITATATIGAGLAAPAHAQPQAQAANPPIETGQRPIADFDGDGKADIAVWRPANGTWYIVRSSDGGNTVVQWGQAGDVPVPADYDGDRKADITIFRPSDSLSFHTLRSSDGRGTRTTWIGRDPVVADYDGDRKTDVATWTDGNWFIQRSTDRGTTSRQWGQVGDIPV